MFILCLINPNGSKWALSEKKSLHGKKPYSVQLQQPPKKAQYVCTARFLLYTCWFPFKTIPAILLKHRRGCRATAWSRRRKPYCSSAASMWMTGALCPWKLQKGPLKSGGNSWKLLWRSDLPYGSLWYTKIAMEYLHYRKYMTHTFQETKSSPRETSPGIHGPCHVIFPTVLSGLLDAKTYQVLMLWPRVWRLVCCGVEWLVGELGDVDEILNSPENH